jgi:hypothetical protein
MVRQRLFLLRSCLLIRRQILKTRPRWSLQLHGTGFLSLENVVIYLKAVPHGDLIAAHRAAFGADACKEWFDTSLLAPPVLRLARLNLPVGTFEFANSIRPFSSTRPATWLQCNV